MSYDKLRALRLKGETNRYKEKKVDIYDTVPEHVFVSLNKSVRDEDFVVDDVAGEYRGGLHDWDQSSLHSSDDEENARVGQSKGKKKVGKVEKKDKKRMFMPVTGVEKVIVPTETETQLLDSMFQDLDDEFLSGTSRVGHVKGTGIYGNGTRAHEMGQEKKKMKLDSGFTIPTTRKSISTIFNAANDTSTFNDTSSTFNNTTDMDITDMDTTDNGFVNVEMDSIHALELNHEVKKEDSISHDIMNQDSMNLTIKSEVKSEIKSDIINQVKVKALKSNTQCQDASKFLPKFEKQEANLVPLVSSSEPIMDWKKVKQTEVDSNSVPTTKTNVLNTDEHVYMYWLDAFEKNGTVYLFGKIMDQKTNTFHSCCVSIKNIQRNVYLLPRSFVLHDNQDGMEHEGTTMNLHR
jgi:DNA polymerase alpha subunit A